MKKHTSLWIVSCLCLGSYLHLGCSFKTKKDIISIDGSSTVYPIAEAVAEEFQKKTGILVTIGVSGSGGGFKKFCRGETSITNASRPIKPSEVELCKTNGIEYIELPIAYDGIAVVAHKQADWVDSLTVDELRKIWQPESQGKLLRWNQIRSEWPNQEIHLFGPGVDSGTYDYFTQAIVGKEHASRGDFTSSEDDNVLVQGISTDKSALGFFGYAYYSQNRDKLKVIGIDDGKEDNGPGPIAPSIQSVADGTYQPLSRPLFIYISKRAASQGIVDQFVTFFLHSGQELVQEVGYISMPPRAYQLAKQRYEKRVTGSLFHGQGSKVGVTIEQLMGE